MLVGDPWETYDPKNRAKWPLKKFVEDNARRLDEIDKREEKRANAGAGRREVVISKLIEIAIQLAIAAAGLGLYHWLTSGGG